MITPIPVKATRRRRHVVRATLHLVPKPAAIPVDIRMASPIDIPRVLVLLQHGIAPVPLGIQPLVSPLEILETELVRVATPALTRHEVVYPGRTLGYVGGAGLLVPLVAVGGVPSSV